MPLDSHDNGLYLLHTCVSHGWSSYSHGLIPRKFATGFLKKSPEVTRIIILQPRFLEFHADFFGGEQVVKHDK